MNECMHQLVTDWVNVLLFYFDSRNEAGSLNIFLSIFFFVLKYRRQFKWRQTDYGSKSGHCQFFFPSYCQYRSFETWVKMEPVNFGSLEYRGIFISLSPIGALGSPNFKDLQSHKRVLAPPLLVWFLVVTMMNKKRIKYQLSWTFFGFLMFSVLPKILWFSCKEVGRRWIAFMQLMNCVKPYYLWNP